MSTTPTANPRRPKRGTYRPRPETLALLQVSGNPINGVGETEPRRPSPFFWHPPDQHPWGPLQIVARTRSRGCPGSPEAFQAAYNYPELMSVSAERNAAPAQQLSDQARAFALSHEADDCGIAPMDPLYVFEGYTVNEPWIIVLGLAHNYERLKEVPSDETNGIGVVDETNTRAARALPTGWPIGFAPRDTTPLPTLALRLELSCSSRRQSPPAWVSWENTARSSAASSDPACAWLE